MIKYINEIKKLNKKIKLLENQLKPFLKYGHIYECCINHNNQKIYYIGKWVNPKQRFKTHIYRWKNYKNDCTLHSYLKLINFDKWLYEFKIIWSWKNKILDTELWKKERYYIEKYINDGKIIVNKN